ncbi:winged helix DNA-binding domain-containing protein, partial [Glonium stellatum]
VEFYFSDENLPTDRYLLEFCRGGENLPVSITRICSFKKMRHYKPRSLVVAALRRSAFLDVSEDGKTIKRKIPL